MNMDRWKIIFSPAGHLLRSEDTFADFQLISCAVTWKLCTTHHRGSAFDHCHIFGDASQQLWTDLQYTDAALANSQQVQRHPIQRIQLRSYPWQNCHVSTAASILSLASVGYDTIRSGSYGPWIATPEGRRSRLGENRGVEPNAWV